ncbi:MAG: ABC transporter ATP-binding protein [Rickettsiaceae bacterium]
MQNVSTARYIIARLFSQYIMPHFKKVIIAVVMMIISTLCSVVIVKLVKPVFDDILLTQNRSMLIIMPLVILLVHTIKGIAEYYQTYIIKYLGQKVLTELQLAMYQHLLLSDFEFIQSQSSGKLISRFTNDISVMRASVLNLLIGCAKHTLLVFFLIIVMFSTEPILSCIVFFVFPLAAYPVQKLGQRMRRVSSKVQETLSDYTSKLDETFQSIKIVKSFLAEKTEFDIAKKISNDILTLYRNTAKSDALISPVMEILSGIAIGIILLYGGWMILQGHTTPGDLMSFITAFVTAYRPFKSLLSLNVNLQEGISAAERVFEVLDRKNNVVDSANARDIKIHRPNIQFESVSLRFGQISAINNISFTIEQFKTTALIGVSGSGKTSITNLLIRLYNSSSGNINIDKYNINDISIKSLREQISLVTQDTILFDSTIAENIRYAKPDADMDQVIEAARLADAEDFILKLPKQFDTIIGNKGFSLSGGQRQRLSIARAFLKDAKILILDEATSNLDVKSERYVLNSLREFCKDKTTIIITHRLSNIKLADKIIVFKNGYIAEEGKHDELIANHGEYYSLVQQEKRYSN